MSKALNKTGRSILYSCEWPLYEWAYQKVSDECKEFLVPDETIRFVRLQKSIFCACSLTTRQFVRHVTTGATLMTCMTPGALSSPSRTGLPLIKTSSSQWLDLGVGMTPIWYFALVKQPPVNLQCIIFTCCFLKEICEN